MGSLASFKYTATIKYLRGKAQIHNLEIIILTICAVYVFYRNGILDAEIGARYKMGISIYVCPPYAAFECLLELGLWSLFVLCLLYKSWLYREVCRRCRLKSMTIFLILAAVYAIYYSNIVQARRQRMRSEELILDASVGGLANVMINFLWFKIRLNHTGLNIRAIRDWPERVLSS